MGKIKNKNHDRKNKINLVFDEDKRRDYICGFRKRKLERKKKAEEELKDLLKQERKRIKQENKESYKKLVVSSRPIPDIEQLLQEEYEDEDVNVKIVELSSDTLQKKELCIGENRPKEQKNLNLSHKQITNSNTVILGKSKINSKHIPGMDLENVDEQETVNSDTEPDEKPLKTKTEIKRILKHQATKKIQKSKLYQMKNKLDRVKNRKKSQQKSKNKEKAKAKVHKKKKGHLNKKTLQ